MTQRQAVEEFLDYVEQAAAFNGADDKGQRFYDWGLNPWLRQTAERFLAPPARTRDLSRLDWS